MEVKKPKIVIIGAGMSGLTAANKLYTSTDIFDLFVVEGGQRIGGRIHTSEFSGDRIELGAAWIHGISGSPIHQIAQQIKSLESEQNWEFMDGFFENPRTVLEGGLEVNPTIGDSISTLFNKLMDFSQGKSVQFDENRVDSRQFREIAANSGELSVGEFLRRGLDAYWESLETEEQVKDSNFEKRKLLEEAIFAMEENMQRAYTSAGDLLTLDFESLKECKMFPGEEITIAKGYSSIVEALASKLPKGLIQLGKKVTKIEWQNQLEDEFRSSMANGFVHSNKPVKLHFSDGSIVFADHVIVTVSLGVLKARIGQNSGLFSPPLPLFKTEAISRLGFGVVNKLFLELGTQNGFKSDSISDFKFPFLQMAFHRSDSELRNKNVPWWMRRMASICPIYNGSSVLLSWFAGKEALELESLDDEEIINGVSKTISTFLNPNSNSCNGNCNSVRFSEVLKSKWGSDPLFLGSYSYVAVGSSGDDMDLLAEPLPKIETFGSKTQNPLQILFAGEATHRTHYSTTHGAYFSGLREANRLLEHYHCFGA